VPFHYKKKESTKHNIKSKRRENIVRKEHIARTKPRKII
jgi:hypothetical protein